MAGAIDPAVGDSLEVVDAAVGRPPALEHPVLGALVRPPGRPQGQARVDGRGHLLGDGVPATNFGPGDPLLAHTADEHVSRAELEQARAVLGAVLGEGSDCGQGAPRGGAAFVGRRDGCQSRRRTVTTRP